MLFEGRFWRLYVAREVAQVIVKLSGAVDSMKSSLLPLNTSREVSDVDGTVGSDVIVASSVGLVVVDLGEKFERLPFWCVSNIRGFLMRDRRSHSESLLARRQTGDSE